MITIAPPTLADTYAALDAALDPPADDGPPLVLVEAPDETPPESLLTDLANVLTLVDRVFVGQADVRREIARVLDRYADEELIRWEQLTADRAIVAGIVRDSWGVPLALRADCLEMSRDIDLACGF